MCGLAATTVLVASALLGVTGDMYPHPILLDNMDTSLGSEIVNAYEGTYWPCMADAYNKQFHHDWSENKGAASFKFNFFPPADGCYTLEEHHPGKSALCSQYLPRNARLDIDYCKGKSSTIYINQAVQGGQWNEIGTFPLFKGYEGSLTMRNAVNEQCELQGNCFWVVDAFRLTWKGTECLPRNNSEETVQTGKGTEGVLLLRLNMEISHDTAFMQVKIQDQKAALEATLASHFGYNSVEIVEARFVSPGRRLREQPAALMRISFIALEKVAESTSGDLKQSLQANLDAMNLGVTVDSASVEWTLPVPIRTEHDSKNAKMCLPLYIGASCAALVMLGIAGFFVWKLKVRTSNAQTLASDLSKEKSEDPKRAKEVTLEGAISKMPDEPQKAKEVDEAENTSVSTGPPASEDGTHSAGNSIPDSSLKDAKIQHL